MPLLPALPFVLPLLGAGGTIALSLVPRVRSYARYIALAAAGATTILVLSLRWTGPVFIVPSLWQPSLLFGSTPLLRTDVTMQPLAFVLALTTCSAIVTELSRPQSRSLRLMATMLARLSASFVALWSANFLTMVIGWAVFDLLSAVGRVAAGGSIRGALRGLILGSLATLALWVGALLSEGSATSQIWALMTLSDAQLTLVSVAGILRLWAYPLHLSAPDDLADGSPVAASLFLGPLVGWGLWLRLVSTNGGLMPESGWVPAVAAATLAVGSFMAWSCENPRRALPWVGEAVTGAVLLTASLAGGRASLIIVVGSVGWALGVGLLFMSYGLHRHHPWWSVPSLVGALAVFGAPLTLGFVTQASLVGELVSGGRLVWGVVLFAGQLFLIPALARLLLVPSPSPLPSRRLPLVVRGIGLGLPTALLAAAGVHPPLLVVALETPSLRSLFAMPGLAGWLLWVVSSAVGCLLAWQEGNLRPRIASPLGLVHDLLRLEWLYDALAGAVERGLSVLRVADEMVGGAGALLWSWVLFLILLLIWGS